MKKVVKIEVTKISDNDFRVNFHEVCNEVHSYQHFLVDNYTLRWFVGNAIACDIIESENNSITNVNIQIDVNSK